MAWLVVPLKDDDNCPFTLSRSGFVAKAGSAHLQDQVRQRYLDRADGFAGVAAYTQALRPRISLQTVVKRRHDQPDSATVDIAKGVPSNLLVGRADIRGRSGGEPDVAAQAMQTHLEWALTHSKQEVRRRLGVEAAE